MATMSAATEWAASGSRACRFAPLLVCLTASGVVAAAECPELDPQVHRLLHAMSSNAAKVEYSGVVTLQRGGDMQVMEVSHRVQGDSATEVLSRLTGQDARVLRSGHDTQCMHPGQQLLRSSAVTDDGVCGLAASYRFRLGDGGRVAGREALRLRVEPLDMYRFGYVFELDRDTALMLKATTMSSDQRVLEQFQFASLSMDGAPVGDATIEHRAGHPHPEQDEPPGAGPRWRVSWLPDGFLPTDASHRQAPRKSFTDGFASFSVFLEPLATAIKPGEGVERQGSTVAYTRGVMLDSKPVLVTVLGEIPTNTARMVADSVRLN